MKSEAACGHLREMPKDSENARFLEDRKQPTDGPNRAPGPVWTLANRGAAWVGRERRGSFDGWDQLYLHGLALPHRNDGTGQFVDRKRSRQKPVFNSQALAGTRIEPSIVGQAEHRGAECRRAPTFRP